MDFDISSLNWFDIAVISTVGVSTIFALFRGFIKAGFSLVTWVGSAALAFALYGTAYSLFSGHIQSEKVVMALSSVGVFVFLFIVIGYSCSKLVYALRKKRGGVIDRTFGFLFGFVRGVLIVCMVFFSISLLSKTLQIGSEDNPGPGWFVDAKTHNILKVTSYSLLAILPDSVPDRFVNLIDKAKEISTNVIENEIKNGGATIAKTLNDKETKLMQQVVSAIPKEKMVEIYNKYEGSSSELSELEQMAIFREILKEYNEASKNNEIPKDKKLSETEIFMLKAALNDVDSNKDSEIEEEAGYKDFNIKQMDRLIENVQ